MKKTLKTLINTGLFMLCFSHSHGLALVYNLNDVVNKTGGSTTLLMSSTTHPGFNGIDDTFNGSVTFNFTMTYDLFPSGSNNFDRFAAFNIAYGPDSISIGSINSDYWNGYLSVALGSNQIPFGTNSVIEGQSQEFTLTIDYNAGALDTGTLLIAGDPTIYNIGDRDYTFGTIDFSISGGSIASVTNVSVSIVPEPATYAFLSGALALVFVAVRQRFKA